MSIQAEKLSLIEWIISVNDLSIIEKIKNIHEDYSKKADWWDDLSIDDKESIERGLSDITNNKVYSHESARKIYEKYL